MPKKPLYLALMPLFLAPAVTHGQQCTAVSKPPRSVVAPSGTNPQYFVYNNRTQPLIGASTEYLCHVVQPGTFGTAPAPSITPAQDYCEFTNYRSYIDTLTISSITGGTIEAKGLNTLRLWVSLNSSPGTDRNGRPYDHEAPFKHNCGPWPASCPSPVWQLSAPYDDTFYDRLKCVLDYAWSQEMVVELSIFAPWSGNFAKSPWASAFSSRGCFASKDFAPGGVRCDAVPQNVTGWNLQKAFITDLATRLCSYPNIYYEIANEVDLTGAADQPTPAQIVSWQQDMANTLAATEASLGCGHTIAANVQNTGNAAGLSATYKVIDAHYTEITAAATEGANEMLRSRHNGGGSELNRIFGFNETKLTTVPALFPSLPNYAQTAEMARAEAWEYLLSEGGVYDLYGERWQTSGNDTLTAIRYLKFANGFLAPLNMNRMRRSLSVGNAPPSWIQGLGNYASGNLRWGAMESNMAVTGDANVLYIHHSTLDPSIGSFKRYLPQTGSYGPESFSVVLPAGNYLAQWISPSSGLIYSQSAPFTVTTSGTPTALPASPSYTFDIALRITRQP